MILSDSNRKILFYTVALFFFIAAIYHAVGIFYKVNDVPVWRHALFVAINLFCVYGLLKRPRYFLYFFCVLIIQQYLSHGSQLINLWYMEHRIDWISLAVLVLLPIGLLGLLDDFKANKIAETQPS